MTLGLPMTQLDTISKAQANRKKMDKLITSELKISEHQRTQSME